MVAGCLTLREKKKTRKIDIKKKYKQSRESRERKATDWVQKCGYPDTERQLKSENVLII